MIEKKNLDIVFFGTPEFAVKSLDALITNGFNVKAVVTMPDKPAGRGRKMIESDVKKYAVEKGLPVLQPEKLRNEEFLNNLRELKADLFIVIAFRMLPEVVWGMPRLGTFNLHASLLPKYRGAAPINRAIMNGETKTGVTTFFLTHEIDTGDIIDFHETEIQPDDNAGDLHDRLMEIGAEMVVKTCNDIVDGTFKTYPQPDGEFTPAPKIFKEDCLIDWNQPAQNVHNHIRGLAPYPAAWSLWTDENGNEATIKILQSKTTDEPCTGKQPGEIKIEKHRLFVATADNWLELLKVQPAGKKAMDSSAFLNGNHPKEFTSSLSN